MKGSERPAAIAALLMYAAVAWAPTNSSRTVTKKVPMLAPPASLLVRPANPKGTLKPWQITVEFPRPKDGFSESAVSGFDTTLLSPEAISALASAHADYYHL